jgi:radical SAM superfamily enzyme YgiQ (UPF0313 family)
MDDLSNQITKLRVLLVQLPVPNNPSLNTPLAAGYLKAYAYARGLIDAAEIELLPRLLADHAGDALLVDEIVARRPDVLGVSLYTWNSERSLDIIRRVKERLPGLRVVAGGPEVQKDNQWILQHPAIDVAVVGEGEQTFVDLLRLWSNDRPRYEVHIPLVSERTTVSPLAHIPGIAYCHEGAIHFTPDRVPLNDLSVIPSPYLAGYLNVPNDGMLMVEVSRWCPYSCSFCLYGRNMGAKLGNRYFGLERVLAEIRWGRERGIKRIHFVEANLNLVPLFWPLMHALEDLNYGRQMTFYAELRGEHLTEEVVIALDRANIRYVEVGLQTANLTALKASLRRTDLRKWAAGTRRLYAHGIEVYLDVILGLPADDEIGIAETLDFIQREKLGSYDVFTLQVLPGTAVRQQAQQYGLSFQERPPYYVLATDRLDYGELRRLRRELKHGAGLDPDEIEGCPPPRLSALATTDRRPAPTATASSSDSPIHHIWLGNADSTDWQTAETTVNQLATHVDMIIYWDEAQPSQVVGRRSPALSGGRPLGQGSVACPERGAPFGPRVGRLATLLAHAITENPSTLFDCYLVADTPPPPDALRDWRAALPYSPGYLDRVAVYRRPSLRRNSVSLDPSHERVSPRLWLVLPWTAQAVPEDYAGVAEIIWRFELAEDDPVPFSAWYGAGGAGVWLHFLPNSTSSYQIEVMAAVRQWERETGRRVWGAID